MAIVIRPANRFEDVKAVVLRVDSPGGGVFAGVPTVIKDNENVFGLPTRSGSRAAGGRRAGSHSTSTSRARIRRCS